MCSWICACGLWGNSSAKDPGRKEEGAYARWAGGCCVVVAVLPGLRMTLPSKHSESGIFIKSPPVFIWKQGPFASFLSYAATVIGRACFLPCRIEFRER